MGRGADGVESQLGSSSWLLEKGLFSPIPQPEAKSPAPAAVLTIMLIMVP